MLPSGPLDRPITLFLLHRDGIALDAIAEALDRQLAHASIECATSPESALAALHHSPVIDIAVFDLACGIDAIEALHVRAPLLAEAGLIALVDESHGALELSRFLELGGAGIVRKSASIAHLVTAIERLIAGKSLLSSRETLDIMSRGSHLRERQHRARERFSRLTHREREVILALGDGLTDQQIATRMHIAHETVRTHMVNILRKLELDNRLEVLIFALRHGFIVIPGSTPQQHTRQEAAPVTSRSR